MGKGACPCCFGPAERCKRYDIICSTSSQANIAIEIGSSTHKSAGEPDGWIWTRIAHCWDWNGEIKCPNPNSSSKISTGLQMFKYHSVFKFFNLNNLHIFCIWEWNHQITWPKHNHWLLVGLGKQEWQLGSQMAQKKLNIFIKMGRKIFVPCNQSLPLPNQNHEANWPNPNYFRFPQECRGLVAAAPGFGEYLFSAPYPTLPN